MARWRVVVSAVTAGVLLLSGCGSEGRAKDTEESSRDSIFPMAVSDCGRKVMLEERPERVVTVGATASTLVWAAGAADRIATRSSERGVPLGHAKRWLQAIPEVSRYRLLSAKEIVGLSPDLVISSGLPPKTVAGLREAGIPALTGSSYCGSSRATTFAQGSTALDDMLDEIRRYGRIFGTSGVAEARGDDLRMRIRSVQNTSDFSLKSAAAVTVRGDRLTAYGRSSMPHAQITAMGMKNVHGSLEPRQNKIDAKQLVRSDPDVIIVMSSGRGAGGHTAAHAIRDLRKLPGAQRLDAVRNNRIITLELPFMSPSPLAVDGLEKMAAEVEAMQ